MWPIAFLLLGNHTKRLLLVTALFAVWPAWYYLRIHHGNANPMAFDIRCVFLLAGCALALARHDKRLAPWFNSRYLQQPITPLLAIVAICLVSTPLFPVGAVVGALNSAAVAMVINYAVQHKGGFLNARPMVWLGNLSYSLYLWQQLFCWHSKLGWIGHFPQNVIASLIAASLSFYLLEKPLAAVRSQVRFISNPSWLAVRARLDPYARDNT